MRITAVVVYACLAMGSGAWAQVPGDPAISVTVGPAVRATGAPWYEVEPVIAATRTGRVVVSFFDGEALPPCPRGPDNNRTVVWNNFASATGPGTPFRFRDSLVPPSAQSWCVAGDMTPQRDPIAVTDLTDGTTWVGAFQWAPNNQQAMLNNGIWVSRLNFQAGTPLPPTWAALNVVPGPPPQCDLDPPYPLVDKPVMVVGPRPGVVGRSLYVAFVERRACEGGIPQPDGLLRVSRSTDDAVTWS